MSLSRLGRHLAAAAVAGGLTLPLLAAGGGESETFLGLPRWIWLWANLILFLGILYKFIGPPIQGFLESRRKEIAENLSNAEEQRRQAELMRSSLESQIADLKAEMDQLIERARSDGESERQRILEQAEAEKERLLAQTEEEIRVRTSQARNELKRYTAALAADLARQRIEQELAPEDLQRLFDESVARLEKVVSK